MKTFPEDIQCILEPINKKGGIYVSNIEAASNPSTLSKHGIGAVITAIKGKNLDNIVPKYIEYLYVPAIDSDHFNISYYFDQTYQFIDEVRSHTNVLVHCMAGVSRSVTLVIAYLMRKYEMSFKEVLNYAKSKRKLIHPNEGFIQQLKQYQTSLKIGKKENVRESSLNKMEEKEVVKNYDESLKQNIQKLFQEKTLSMTQTGFIRKIR